MTPQSKHNIQFQFTRNKMKDELPVIEEAVEFFLDELFKRCTIDYRLNVKVSFRSGHVKSDGGTENQGLAWSQEQDGEVWYVVQLNIAVPFLELLSTLAHELVHISQFATKRLTHTDSDEWIWEGVNFGAKPYTGKEELDTRLPWEYDAYSKETELARKFVKKFYSNW